MSRTDRIVSSGRQATLQEEFVRFAVGQRLEHFLVMTCFIALLLTGLPQKFDEASGNYDFESAKFKDAAENSRHHAAAIRAMKE